VTPTLQTLLDERAAELVGRDDERAMLLALSDRGRPIVAVVHGIAGVGKSALLGAAAVDARAHGSCVLALDGGSFEPTERGFLAALAQALGDDQADVLAALGAKDRRVVLVVDGLEHLRLLDGWLRLRFVPTLPANVRLLLAGRDVPSNWQRELGDLALTIRLDNLAEVDAREVLRRDGFEPAAADRLARLARGHPLSLRLAAAALAERPGLDPQAAVLGPVVEELAHQYLDSLEPLTRRALDAASVVRRATMTLLEAMLPDEDPTELFRRLRALPFVELGLEGLSIHDTVREATAGLLRAADAGRFRAHRQAAWARLRREVATAPAADLWRYTADMLYLVENPIVRDAFFPPGAEEYAIEPPSAAAHDAVMAIGADRAVPEVAALVDAWWRAVPDAFRVVRDAAGAVQAFSATIDPADVPLELGRRDPVMAMLREHLRAEPLPRGQRALIARFSLAAGSGEAPSPAAATLWLDTKRSYLELRPQLRRMYVPAVAPETTLAALAPLGFRATLLPPVAVGSSRYTLLCNDFGPGSIDGWLGDVVGRELEVGDPQIIDVENRRLMFDGRPVDLSPLELDLLVHLRRREGVTVTRRELLHEVWGHEWTDGSSNVVEVVVSGLRRKLGDRASALETVRGVGYRLGPLD
jgi:hypothetical protein